jgi:putative ABC transport system substrate-binding protein
MNRRDTVLALLALGAAPLATRAQPAGKPARIAWLGFTSPEAAGYFLDAFKQGLRELGYVEGKSFVFEARWAFGKYENLSDLARDLAAQQPDVIFVSSGPTIRAMQQATTTIPIVMTNSGDPVGSGFVRSLSRPGGNITGLSTLNADLSPKLLELLLTIVPKLSTVAILWNPKNTVAAQLTNIQKAAQQVKVEQLTIEVQTPAEIESAFAGIVRAHIGAAIVLSDALFFLQRSQIAELAIKNRIPLIFSSRDYAEAGGLISYGTNQTQGFRDAASYVDKILKGAKPGDLPVQQSSKFELVINLKTAKALGLTIPRSILLRADEVIQ